MTKYEETDDEIWADLREIQSSMSISGFELSEAQMQEVFERTKASPVRRALIDLKKRSDETGEDYGTLVDEFLDKLDRERKRRL